MLFPPRTSSSFPARVVVTGCGLVTPLGLGWETNARGFRAGRTAFTPITAFDVSRQRVKTAGQVQLPDRLPRTRLSARQEARLDRAARMLILAADEAWQGAGNTEGMDVPVVLGTTAGGMTLGEEYYRQAIHAPNSHRGQAARALHYQAQVQAGVLAEALGCCGPVTVLANACASGANAVGCAWDTIRRGRADRVLAGGYDALCQLVFAGFDSLQALSPTICRPFDAHRDGLSMGEGAALLLLENLDSARRRGAAIFGEITGYASVIDLHHLTQPHPEGAAAANAMARACASAQITPAEVDYVNAHGTGTPLNDSSEALAIRAWAGARATTLPVSSVKGGIGHLLGAAGAVETVVCLMALREQWLPPETTLDEPDPLCTFPIVRKPVDRSVQVVVSNSFGFGGVNASLVIRRWA